MRLIRILSLLILCQIAASAQAQHAPALLTQGNSTRALAVESPTYQAEPFSLKAKVKYSDDDQTRLIFFASNIQDAKDVTATAETDPPAFYPLTVEFVGAVPECDSLYYVVVRLTDNLPADAGDVQVWITSQGLSSNHVRVGIGHIGGGLPDNRCQPTFVAYDGNSLVRGESASGFNYYFPTQTQNLIGCGWDFVNLGVNNITTPELSARAPVVVDPLIRPGVRNVLVFWEISNHMALPGGFASSEDAFAAVKDYCLARRKAGWDYIVVLTVLPRAGIGVFSPEWFEERRQPLNSMLRAHYHEFADALVDVGNEGTIGLPGSEFGPLFDTDRTHLLDAGYRVPAAYTAQAILSLN